MRKRPLVPILVLFAVALSLAPKVTCPSAWLSALVALGAGVLLAPVRRPLPQVVQAIGLLVCVAGVAVLRYRLADISVPDHLASFCGVKSVTLEGFLRQPPQELRDSTRLRVEVKRLLSVGGNSRSCRGRVLVYVDQPCPPAPASDSVVFRGKVGDWVRVTGCLEQLPEATNPGEYDERGYWSRDGYGVRMRVGVGAVRVLATPPHHALQRAADGVRERLARQLAVAAGESPDRPGLLSRVQASVVYGIHAAPLPRLIEESFRRSGTIHLLVVSGTQVAFLITFLLVATGLFPKWVRLVLLAAALLMYLLVTLQPPSIVRACLMGAVALLALYSGRDFDPLNALACAGLVVLGANPRDLHDVGLQLSFGACLGIILITPGLMRLLRALPQPLAFAMGGTAGAQLGALPLLAFHFGSVPAAGFVANLVAIPAAALLLGISLILCVSAVLPAFLSLALGAVGASVTTFLIRTAQLFAQPQHATLTVRPGNEWWLVLGYGALGAAVALDSPRVRQWLSRERWLTIGAVALTCTVIGTTWQHCRPRQLAVTFLDVGQGDSVLVRTPGRKALLIDGGSHDRTFRDVGERIILPYLAERGIGELEAVVVTHGHADHVNGLETVLDRVHVKRLLTGTCQTETSDMQSLLLAAKAKGIPVESIGRGDRIELEAGVTLWALWPPDQPLVGTDDDVNNNSVVLKLAYGQVSFLLTGDLQEAGERQLLQYGDQLRSTVLKGGHHGGKGTLCQPWLEAVQPRAVVLSVGRNNAFGHPDATLLIRLRHTECQVFQTSRAGAITFRTDGRGLSAETFADHRRQQLLPQQGTQ